VPSLPGPRARFGATWGVVVDAAVRPVPTRKPLRRGRARAVRALRND